MRVSRKGTKGRGGGRGGTEAKLEPRARGATELEPTVEAIGGSGGKGGGCKEIGTGKVEDDEDAADGTN